MKRLQKNISLNEWVEKLMFLRTHAAILSDQLQAQLDSLFDGNTLSKAFCLESFKQACLGESNMAIVLQKNLVYFL